MAWTQSDLDSIDQAIAQGVAEVRFADRTVRYRSIDDLLKARDAISQTLANQQGSVIKRHLRIYTGSGWDD